MLAVHRQHLHPAAPRGRHHDLARHHKDFLAGDRDVLPGLDRSERGAKPAGADDGDEHQVRLGQCRQLHKPLLPAQHLRVQRRDFRMLAAETHGARLKLARQRCERLRIRVRGKPHDPHSAGDVPRDLGGALADRAGGAEHHHLPLPHPPMRMTRRM